MYKCVSNGAIILKKDVVSDCKPKLHLQNYTTRPMLELVGCSDAAVALKAACQSNANVIALLGPPACGKSTLIRAILSELNISINELKMEECWTHAEMVETFKRTLLGGTSVMKLSNTMSRDHVVLIDNIDSLLEIDKSAASVIPTLAIKSSKRIMITGPLQLERKLTDWKIGRMKIVKIAYPTPSEASAYMQQHFNMTQNEAKNIVNEFHGCIYNMVQTMFFRQGTSGGESPTRFFDMSLYDVVSRILCLHNPTFNEVSALTVYDNALVPILLYDNGIRPGVCNDICKVVGLYAMLSALEHHGHITFEPTFLAMHASLCSMAVVLHLKHPVPNDVSSTHITFPQTLNRCAHRYAKEKRLFAAFTDQYLTPYAYTYLLMEATDVEPFKLNVDQSQRRTCNKNKWRAAIIDSVL